MINACSSVLQPGLEHVWCSHSLPLSSSSSSSARCLAPLMPYLSETRHVDDNDLGRFLHAFIQVELAWTCYVVSQIVLCLVFQGPSGLGPPEGARETSIIWQYGADHTHIHPPHQYPQVCVHTNITCCNCAFRPRYAPIAHTSNPS